MDIQQTGPLGRPRQPSQSKPVLPEEDFKKLHKRFCSLRSDANNWLPTWKDVKRWGNPTRGFFEGQDPKQARKINHREHINNTLIRALRTATAGLHSGLTSPSRPWFRLTVGDPDLAEDNQVRMWLDAVETRIYSILNMSNIYKALPMMYAELLQFGVVAAPLEEDYESVIYAKVLTCGQYYLGVDDKGQVNTFARRIDYSVSEIVATFGYDNCPQTVQNDYDNSNVDRVYQVHHIIEPNDNRIEDVKDFRGMAYRSVYYIPGYDLDGILRVGGFHEFPIIAPRWETTKTSDVYGVSPAMYAMGDQRTLQKMERDGLIGLAKMVDPPIVATGTSKNLNTAPGGISTYTPSATTDASVKPVYQVNIDFNALANGTQRVEQRINETLYVDLFRMILDNNQAEPITAQEVIEKHQEKMMNLGPVLESMNQELHEPLIRRIYNVMLRGGLIPEPPPQMNAALMKVEFISVLAQAQQMVATTTIQQSLGFIGGVAGLFPDVVDVVNIDEAAIDYMQANGMPAKCIRGKDEIQAIRQQKQQAQAQAEQQQNMAAMVQGAKTLSDARLEGNNALTALTGMGGQGGTGV